jgi:hypothetical protein
VRIAISTVRTAYTIASIISHIIISRIIFCLNRLIIAHFNGFENVYIYTRTETVETPHPVLIRLM